MLVEVLTGWPKGKVALDGPDVDLGVDEIVPPVVPAVGLDRAIGDKPDHSRLLHQSDPGTSTSGSLRMPVARLGFSFITRLPLWLLTGRASRSQVGEISPAGFDVVPEELETLFLLAAVEPSDLHGFVLVVDVEELPCRFAAADPAATLLPLQHRHLVLPGQIQTCEDLDTVLMRIVLLDPISPLVFALLL